MSYDPTEQIRREMVAEINCNPGSREDLESRYGKGNVYDTQELTEAFEVLGFGAPLVKVVRKSDGVRGYLLFQHHPRFYWGFQPTE